MPALRKSFEDGAKAGCGGFVLNFDDLTEDIESHWSRCPKCRERFNSLAEWELSFIQEMADTAKACGVKKLIVCPTPYMRDAADQPKYKDYFKTLCAPEFMKDTLVFHCEFMPDKIRHLEELGLKNYIWWNNGLFPSGDYYEGLYMGIDRLHYIWYGHHPTPEDAVAPLPGVTDALKSFGTFCKHVYPSPTGSFTARAMGGCLAWNPEQTVEKQHMLRRSLAEMLYGRGAWEFYKSWEENMGAWFASYHYNIADADTAKMEAQLDQAQKAFEKMSAIHDAAKGFDAPSPLLKSEELRSIVEMNETMEKARKALKSPALLPAIENPSTKQAPQGANIFLPFDNCSGDRLHDSVKTERLVLFKGGAPSRKKGFEGNAIFLNGKDDCIEIPASSANDLNPGHGSFTIMCRVYMMGHAWNMFAGKRSSGRDIYRCPGWSLGSDRRGNAFRFNLEDNDGNCVSLTAPCNDMLYRWHSIAATRSPAKDGKAGELCLYLDGALLARKPDNTGDVSNSMPLVFGSDRLSGGQLWGLIDEFAYWPKALSEEELKANAE